MFVNVRMFLNTYAFVVMIVMFIIMSMRVFVNYHFMNMVMRMFFIH